MNDKIKNDTQDDFWDLSSYAPSKSTVHQEPNEIKTAKVEIPVQKYSHGESAQSDTVIKRYIDPMHYEHKKIKKAAIEHSDEYVPQSGLLHKVNLKKMKSAYNLYENFIKSARKYLKAEAKEAPYVSFYSYVPQYDQLSSEQLEYYLWWRECFNNDVLIKVDLSYVILYIYEIINLGDEQDVFLAATTLAKLWNNYHEAFPAISSKLAVWICDFCLLHRLPPPVNIDRSITKYTPSLSEFFIDIRDNDPKACAISLLKYGTEYDYRKSKFATEKNLPIFEKHVIGAVITAINFFSKDGKFLSELVSEDSRIIRNAFEGALCASKWKYEIDVKYFSFSRSNEIRFIMGDIVKYAENKIRAFLGIKSRLSVYSVGTELQNALNSYFEAAFSNERPPVNKKVEEKHEYDVLYESPSKPFSLAEAKKIENDSWGTTNELLCAFEDGNVAEKVVQAKPMQVPSGEVFSNEENEESGLIERLGEYLCFVQAVKHNDSLKIAEISKKFGMLPEALCDIINEIAVDTIGDILIECEENKFEMIECYRDYIGD